MKTLKLILILWLASYGLVAQRTLVPGHIAPDFSIVDVYGDTVRLSDFKGKKVLINFYRSVGCPVCNLYFHSLQEHADSFRQQGLVIISVYESPAAPMKKYLEGEEFYSYMIPDSTERLYHLYRVQRSWWKMFKSNFTGTYRKIRQGYKLYNERLKYDAHMNRINADFLIDEHGQILVAYYGRYFGDHVGMDVIRNRLLP